MKLFRQSDFLKEFNEDIDFIFKKQNIKNYTVISLFENLINILKQLLVKTDFKKKSLLKDKLVSLKGNNKILTFEYYLQNRFLSILNLNSQLQSGQSTFPEP